MTFEKPSLVNFGKVLDNALVPFGWQNTTRGPLRFSFNMHIMYTGIPTDADIGYILSGKLSTIRLFIMRSAKRGSFAH